MRHRAPMFGAALLAAGCFGVAGAAGVAWGQGQSYGEVASAWDFATIGDPGNRGPIASEVPWWGLVNPGDPPPDIGRVDYEYRIATTEVTVAQHFEFVKAYEPFYYQLNPDSPTADSAFTGRNIQSTTFTATSLLPGVDPQQPTNIGWEYAARYVNWLHNGKVNELWAFESGVYDTSTFGENGDGTLTHDVEPAAGARFWLPRRDEWVKAAHYDPDRYGAGEGGYWEFGDSSDT